MEKSDWGLVVFFSIIGGVLAVLAVKADLILVKCIWSVLAIGVMVFTIYAVIDAVVKKRKKAPQIAKTMKTMVNQEFKSVESKDAFMQRLEEKLQNRRTLFMSQRPEAEDYGISFENPIMTSTIENSNSYLRRLRTPEGKKLTWHRLGAYSVKEIGGVTNVMVDEYQLFLEGTEYMKIYICPYGMASNYVPHSLVLMPEDDKN